MLYLWYFILYLWPFMAAVNRLPIFDSDDVFHCIASEVLKKNRTKTLASS